MSSQFTFCFHPVVLYMLHPPHTFNTRTYKAQRKQEPDDQPRISLFRHPPYIPTAMLAVMHKEKCSPETHPLPPAAQKLQGWYFQQLCETCVEIIRLCRKSGNILFDKALFPACSKIDEFNHSTPLRSDKSAPPQT